MALIKNLISDPRAMTRDTTEVDGFYYVNNNDGNILLHIVNSSEAENSPNHKRQAMTFNEQSLRQLRDILNTHFDLKPPTR